MNLHLLACQIEIPRIRDAAARDAHLARTAEKIRKAIGPGLPDLVVLPELSALEYSDDAFTCLDALEEPMYGPSFETYSTLARTIGAGIVYGFALRDGDARYICQAVVDSRGKLVGHFEKLHLANYGASAETAHFSPGHQLFVFELHGLRIAPLICYDIRFPELVRRLVELDVDVVLQCSAYTRDLSFYSWRHFVVARAMEAQVAWLGLNRAGDGWGGSVYSAPFVDASTPEQQLGSGELFWPIEIPYDQRAKVRAITPYHADRRGDYAELPVIEGGVMR
jgi:predicted amidohydrolase